VVLRACVLWAALAADAAGAQDDIATQFRIDDADPENAIPTREDANRAPLQMGYWVMLVTERAMEAEKKGSLEAAARYYRALAKAIPDRRSGFARLCLLYPKMGEWALGVQSCKAVLARPGAMVEDAVRLVQLLLAKGSPLSAQEIETADAVIAHVAIEADKAEQAQKAKAAASGEAKAELLDIAGQRRIHAQLLCELGTALQDEARLERCTTALAKLAPGDARTLSFTCALALLQGDFDRAKTLVERAKQAELPAAAIERMKGRLVLERDRQSFPGRVRSWMWSLKRNPAWLAYPGIVLLALGAGLIFFRGRPAQAT
jgi:hypothetical protein